MARNNNFTCEKINLPDGGTTIALALPPTTADQHPSPTTNTAWLYQRRVYTMHHWRVQWPSKNFFESTNSLCSLYSPVIENVACDHEVFKQFISACYMYFLPTEDFPLFKVCLLSYIFQLKLTFLSIWHSMVFVIKIKVTIN